MRPKTHLVPALIPQRRPRPGQQQAKRQAAGKAFPEIGPGIAPTARLTAAANTLRTGTSYDETSVVASDNTVLTASAATTATPGSYTIGVSQLATAHQITNKAAKAVANTTTDIVSGASATFKFKVGSGSEQTVTLGAAATLDDLKTAINDLGAGVSASILNTGTDASPAYRLVLTSNDTGQSNAITITGDTTDLDFLNTSGTGGTDTLQAAQDAILVLGDPDLNPVTLQRSSNTITDAIPGVTLNLKSTTPNSEPVTLTVSHDTSAVAGNIKAVVTAYNDIVNFINQRTTYDTQTNTGGDFVGEGTARTVLSQIRQSLFSTVPGLTSFAGVSQIGFQTQRDGTITLDQSALDGALASNYSDVRKLFLGQTGTTGVGQQLYDAVNALDDVQGGALTLRQNGLNDQISKLSDAITRKQQDLSDYQDRLQLQFASLDALLQQLKTQSTYLSQLGAGSSG